MRQFTRGRNLQFLAQLDLRFLVPGKRGQSGSVGVVKERRSWIVLLQGFETGESQFVPAVRQERRNLARKLNQMDLGGKTLVRQRGQAQQRHAERESNLLAERSRARILCDRLRGAFELSIAIEENGQAIFCEPHC